MRSLDVSPVPFDPATAGLALLVIDTRAEHHLTDGLYGERREACSAAARELNLPALRDVLDLDHALGHLSSEVLRRRARHVITENLRTLACAELLRAGRIAEIGPVLSSSHESMRDDFEITVPEVDLAFETLLDAGALGARMTGGGFGGCVIALIDNADVDAASTRVREKFHAHGYRAPTHFCAEASAGVGYRRP
jgi:galactokinase